MKGQPSPGIAEATQLAKETEIEQALIGRVMVGDKGKAVEPPRLPPSRLASPRHRIIWGCILDLHRKGLPYDEASVITTLRDRGELDSAGGVALVGVLQGRAGPVASFGHYLSLIGRRAAQRALGGASRALGDLSLTIDDRPEASVKARYHSIIRRADMLCDYASRNGHSRHLTHLTAYDVLSGPIEPLEWVYEPWLAPGDIVILAGESGLGKSWLALDLMFSLGLGRPWLGRAYGAGRRQRVLYLDEENNRRLVRHRMRKLVDGYDIGMGDLDPANAVLDYGLENGVNFDDPASFDLLKTELEKLRPDWVIFDSLIRLHRRDENSNAQMGDLIGGVIKGLVRSVGAGAIIIHHLGKSSKDRPESRIADRLRGASSLRGDCDQIWGVERSGDALRMVHVKSRMMQESAPVAIELEDTHLGNGIRIVAKDEEVEADGLIRDMLGRAGASGMDRSALIEALEEAGLKAAARVASKVLGRLHSKGEAKKMKDGRQMRYFAADVAPEGAE